MVYDYKFQAGFASATISFAIRILHVAMTDNLRIMAHLPPVLLCYRCPRGTTVRLYSVDKLSTSLDLTYQKAFYPQILGFNICSQKSIC